jgi:hypothetical protein
LAVAPGQLCCYFAPAVFNIAAISSLFAGFVSGAGGLMA